MTDVQEVAMPLGAKPLCVQLQGDQLCMWALVDPREPPAQRTVRIAGTGHRRDDISAEDYLGTYQLMGGSLVFHVFV